MTNAGEQLLPPTVNVDATIHFDRFNDDSPGEFERVGRDSVLWDLASDYAAPSPPAEDLTVLYLQDGDPGFPIGDVVAAIVAGGNGVLAAESPYVVVTPPQTVNPGQPWRFQLLWRPDLQWLNLGELPPLCEGAYFTALDTPFVARVTSQAVPGFAREFLAAWGWCDADPHGARGDVDVDVDEGRPMGTRWITPVTSIVPA